MRHLAALLCCAVAAARFWITFSDRERPIWRVSLTLAVGLIFLCAILRYEFSRYIDLAVPNMTEAISYSLLVASVGMANVYLDSLVDNRPSWRASRHHVVISLIFAGIIITSWSTIPHVHDANVRPGINRLPMSPSLLIFNLAAFGSLLPVGLRVLRFCRRKIRSNAQEGQPEPGARMGLTLIWVFSWVGMAGCFDVCASSLLRLRGSQPLPADSLHLKIPPLANAVCLSGLTTGVLILLMGPRIAALRVSRRNDRLILPLWECLVRHNPHVVMPHHQSAVRRLIEVHDALAIHSIPEACSHTVQGIAEAIRVGSKGEVLAGAALSSIDPRDDAVLRLAAAFNEMNGVSYARNTETSVGHLAPAGGRGAME